MLNIGTVNITCLYFVVAEVIPSWEGVLEAWLAHDIMVRPPVLVLICILDFTQDTTPCQNKQGQRLCIVLK